MPVVSSRFRNMFCATDSVGMSARSWKTVSIPSERAWSTERRFTSTPSTKIAPLSGRW